MQYSISYALDRDDAVELVYILDHFLGMEAKMQSLELVYYIESEVWIHLNTNLICRAQVGHLCVSRASQGCHFSGLKDKGGQTYGST